MVCGPVLAVLAGVAHRARAGVAALAGVVAGGAVGAGRVVSAVVEVLVAEETPPSGLAVALPGLVAGALLAAGVTLALVAVGTGPSGATPGGERKKTFRLQVIFYSRYMILCEMALTETF